MDKGEVRCTAAWGLAAAALLGALALGRVRAEENTDWLTGAKNGAAFRRFLRRRWYAGGLVLARLQGLDELNRTLGYRAGDEALVRAAQTLRACGPGGRLYRIGGCTFALVLPAGKKGGPERAACQSTRAYGAGEAGDRLAVSWAAGPGRAAELLRQARDRLPKTP